MGCGPSQPNRRSAAPIRLFAAPTAAPGLVGQDYLVWVSVNGPRCQNSARFAASGAIAVPAGQFGIARRRFADGSVRLGKVKIVSNHVAGGAVFVENGVEKISAQFEVAYVRSTSVPLLWSPFQYGAPPPLGAVICGEIRVAALPTPVPLFAGMVVTNDPSSGAQICIPGTVFAQGIAISAGGRGALLSSGHIFVLCAPPQYATIPPGAAPLAMPVAFPYAGAAPQQATTGRVIGIAPPGRPAPHHHNTNNSSSYNNNNNSYNNYNDTSSGAGHPTGFVGGGGGMDWGVGSGSGWGVGWGTGSGLGSGLDELGSAFGSLGGDIAGLGQEAGAFFESLAADGAAAGSDAAATAGDWAGPRNRLAVLLTIFNRLA